MRQNWIIGIIMGLISALGLLMASGAEDDIFYGTGLFLFTFGVIAIFALIGQTVGRQ